MYKIGDFYSQNITKDNKLQKGTFPKKSDLIEKENSSRVNKLVPPNLPVKDYLFLKHEKDMEPVNKMRTTDFKSYVENQNSKKFPKQGMKLLIDPYPITAVQDSTASNMKIQKLIKEDLKWHQNNNPKLSATIRQGRIPELKYFTSSYD